MRGRVRSNYFSVRAGIAQKATFARDVEPTCKRNALTHARTHGPAARYGGRESKKKRRGKKACGCHVSRIEGDNGFLFHPCGASSCLSGLWLHE